jgi:hypothetical protein
MSRAKKIKIRAPTDTVKLHIGCNQEKRHPLHLLLETLVSFLIILEKYSLHSPM